MDGVLVDSESVWYRSRIAFAHDLGKTWTMDDQRFAMGRNTIEWAQVMRERLALDMPLDEIIEQVRGRVVASLRDNLPTLPGAIESVHRCAERYPVALASGSPTLVIQTVMALTGLDRVFQHMVYGDDIARGKPHPDIYFEAARRLNVDPSHCVGIEDSSNGIRALHAAGMKVIAVPSPEFPLSTEILALADRHLSSLDLLTHDVIAAL
jgi:beta-phosphoglucomutase-like phosphatase (HAD superfamily)